MSYSMCVIVMMEKTQIRFFSLKSPTLWNAHRNVGVFSPLFEGKAVWQRQKRYIAQNATEELVHGMGVQR